MLIHFWSNCRSQIFYRQKPCQTCFLALRNELSFFLFFRPFWSFSLVFSFGVNGGAKRLRQHLIFKQVVMSNFKMITYRQEGVYKGPHFFILNKGLNSGKPLKKPCPNCFVISCHTNWSFESRIRIWIIFCSNDQKNLSIAIATVIFLLWNGSGKETNYMWYLEELLVFLRKVKKKVCTG